MVYVFEDGEVVTIQDFVVPVNLEYMFKVNLPDSMESYISGNGEGVWACGNKETYNNVINDVAEGICFVKILNDSVYYPGLQCYTLVPIHLRGNKRPVAIFSELIFKYGKSHKEEALNFYNRIHDKDLF